MAIDLTGYFMTTHNDQPTTIGNRLLQFIPEKNTFCFLAAVNGFSQYKILYLGITAN